MKRPIPHLPKYVNLYGSMYIYVDLYISLSFCNSLKADIHARFCYILLYFARFCSIHAICSQYPLIDFGRFWSIYIYQQQYLSILQYLERSSIGSHLNDFCPHPPFIGSEISEREAECVLQCEPHNSVFFRGSLC